MRAHSACSIVVLAIVLVAHDARAQFGGFPGSAGMRGGMRGGTGSDNPTRARSAMPQRPATPEAIDDQLGLLEQALNLTQPQWAAWQPYVDRVRALAADVERERRRAPLAEKQNAVQQLDHGADTLRNRLTAIEDISAAARKLYGSLTPEQKEIADGRLSKIVLRLVGAPPAGTTDRRARQVE